MRKSFIYLFAVLISFTLLYCNSDKKKESAEGTITKKVEDPRARAILDSVFAELKKNPGIGEMATKQLPVSDSSAISPLSQRAYTITYMLPDASRTLANGLLLHNNDMTGFLRLAWFDKKQQKKIILDMELAKEAENQLIVEQVNDTFLICKADVIKAVSGNLPEMFEQEDFFLLLCFKKNKSTNGEFLPCTDIIPEQIEKDDLLEREIAQNIEDNNFFNPVTIITNAAGQPVLKGEKSPLTSFKPISNFPLDKMLLSDFFKPEELPNDEIANFSELTAARNKLRPTLYCITVINVTDNKINNTTVLDRDRVTHFGKKIAAFINLKYVPINLEGKNFAVKDLRETINNINPGKNDIILFTYSGHGFSFNNSPDNLFPQISLLNTAALDTHSIRVNSINIEEVYNLVKSKGSGLNLVISDCCNNEIGIPRIEDPISTLRPWPIPWNRRRAVNFFMNEKGSFLMTAAKKGQLAAGTSRLGGFFTFTFFQKLEEFLRIDFNLENKKRTWNDFLPGVKSLAKSISSTISCGKGPCNQDMIFKMN
jgi:hypothetical protein